jgi:hypothetical protein
LEFLSQAARIRSEIQTAIDQPAWHLGGILRIQDIFQNNKHRLYHWSEDRSVRAGKNLAERDLRPSVIICEVIFGTASDGGAQTRSTPTTVITTQRERDLDTEQQLIMALDVYLLLLFPSPDQDKASDLSLLQKKLHL